MTVEQPEKIDPGRRKSTLADHSKKHGFPMSPTCVCRDVAPEPEGIWCSDCLHLLGIWSNWSGYNGWTSTSPFWCCFLAECSLLLVGAECYSSLWPFLRTILLSRCDVLTWDMARTVLLPAIWSCYAHGENFECIIIVLTNRKVAIALFVIDAIVKTGTFIVI